VPFTPTAPPPPLLLLVAMVIRRHRGVTSSVVARRMRSYSPTRRGARTEIDVRATSVSSTVTALAVDPWISVDISMDIHVKSAAGLDLAGGRPGAQLNKSWA